MQWDTKQDPRGCCDPVTLPWLCDVCVFYVLLPVLLIFVITGRSIAFRGDRGNDESPMEMIKVSHLK